jgi:hypothetical protein
MTMARHVLKVVSTPAKNKGGRPKHRHGAKTEAGWRKLLKRYAESYLTKSEFLEAESGGNHNRREAARKRLDRAINFAWEGGAAVPAQEVVPRTDGK